MMKITPLENEVMAVLLDSPNEVIGVLRNQFRSSSILRRELTGGGFFVYFSVPEQLARLSPTASFTFGDTIATLQGLQFGAGFLLHVKNGVIEFLEGYSYEEVWPEDISDFKVSRDEGLTKEKMSILESLHNP